VNKDVEVARSSVKAIVAQHVGDIDLKLVLVKKFEKEMQIKGTALEKGAEKADSLHKVKGKEVNQARWLSAQRIRPGARWRRMYDLAAGRAERNSQAI
jgi:hypothetical protein